MNTKDDLKDDRICIKLKLGDKEILFKCAKHEEEAVRKSAERFNEIHSQYYEHFNHNIDEKELLRITGFHFAYQFYIQST